MMGWRGSGWRASFSPSVDSVTHPWAATQTRHTPTSLGVISNKRIVMALVKSPLTISCLLHHSQRGHSAWITWPGGSSLSLFILRTHSTITHPSIAIISPFGQAKWSMKKNEWVGSHSCVQTCAFICIYMSERASEREGGRWVLMCIWAGRTIVYLHFY